MEEVMTFYKREKASPIKEVKFTDLELGEHFGSDDFGLCIKISEDKFYSITHRLITDVTDKNYCAKAVTLTATWNYIYQ